MSETKQLGVTIKAPESDRYAADNPWFVFEGDPQTIGRNIVETFQLEGVEDDASLAEIVLTAQTTLTALAHAVRGTKAHVAQAPAAPVDGGASAQGGWQRPAQQPSRPQGGGQGNYGAQTHPEGKTCELAGCGQVLEFKKTSSGKGTWRCPAWRWNNGNPNGHSQEWQ